MTRALPKSTMASTRLRPFVSCLSRSSFNVGFSGRSVLLFNIITYNFTAFRSSYTTRTPTSEEVRPTEPPVTTLAMNISESLNKPKNGAGQSHHPSSQSGLSLTRVHHRVSTEYVLSTLDKIVNWARQGSMWPMTFGKIIIALFGLFQH